MNFNLLFPISIFLYSQAVSAYTCYWPSGSVAQSNYVACNSTAAVSACCAVNDACTTFGWCLGSSGFVYRGGCTDPHWSTNACQKDYCYTTNVDNFQNLLNCDTGSPPSGGSANWCCSISGSSTCCSSSFHIAKPSDPSLGLTGIAFMPDIESPHLTLTVPASTITTTTGANGNTITVTASGSTSTSFPVASSGGLAKGAVAGVSVGSAVIGAVVGLLIGFCLFKRSRKERLQTLPPPESYGYPNGFLNHKTYAVHEAHGTPLVEAPANYSRVG